MRRGVRTVRWGIGIVVALLLSTLVVASADATATKLSPVPVVRSLEPKATEALWRELVRHPRQVRLQGECRPLRGVFYAATDWLRLATKLATAASPCAQYYVSVPPVVSDKTKLRPGEAARIRALGGNFHALAEIHWSAWSKWVATTGSTWYAAGVEVRKRMAEAGFDVAAGDTWAVNEFPSTVRSGAGAARANAQELVRGLYEGDGSREVRGVVFIVGIGQSTGTVSVYQTNLQNWLADAAFWTDMGAYVTDWSQEVYADYRRYAVPGAELPVRRDYANDYLQHALVAAAGGPATIAVARGYLPQAFSPLAAAAWQYDTGYGWSMIPFDQMQAFVSGQIYALRSFSAGAGLAQDHWGFAWQPRNAAGLSAGDFASQTGAILDRLAVAIRDSGQIVDPNDPGSGACGPPGQNLYCTGDFDGAQFAEQWKAFRAWSQPVLSFAGAPPSVVAGSASTPLGLALSSSAGAPQIATTPVVVTLGSSSMRGGFSLTANGPWAPTLTVTIPAGSNLAPPFFYRDEQAGRTQLRASTPAATTATQIETVEAAPPSSLRIDPSSSSLAPRRSQHFSVTAVDPFGNPVSVRATWAVLPASLGTVKPTIGATTTLTIGNRGGVGRLVATASGANGAITGSARLAISPGVIRVASIRYAAKPSIVRTTVSIVDAAGAPVQNALASVVIGTKGRQFFSGRKRTDRKGRATFMASRGSGCYATKVTNVTSPGYRWNGKTPANRFCP